MNRLAAEQPNGTAKGVQRVVKGPMGEIREMLKCLFGSAVLPVIVPFSSFKVFFGKASRLWAAAILSSILLAGPPAAFSAADGDHSNSSPYIKHYKEDNQVSVFGDPDVVPNFTWNSFDMAFYNGQIFKIFYRHDLDFGFQHDAITYYSHGVDEEPQSSPQQTSIDFCSPPIFSSAVKYICSQKITALRLVVFEGRLYLFYLKAAYPPQPNGATQWSLWYRKYDDSDSNPSPAWTAPVNLWTFTAGAGGAYPPRAGMVAKAMNNRIYLLVQPVNSPLYVLSMDFYEDTTGEQHRLLDFDASQPQSFNLHNASDLVLNGDVFLKITDNPNDHRNCIVFVTKDDGTDAPMGLCRLYVYDPADGPTGSMTLVQKIPNGPNGKGWKDLAVAHGNVDLCTPYSVNAIQIWGLPWDDKHLYHTQFVFDDNGTTGSFNASGWQDVTAAWSDAANSTYFKNYMRGLLAAGAFPSQTSESDGTSVLQMHHWVWWFGEDTGSHLKGRSMAYLGDYLRFENHSETDTSTDLDEPNPAAILMGIVTGLPPYYPNGGTPEELEELIGVEYGVENETEIESTVTTDASFSFGYSKEHMLKSSGVDGEFGLSYTHAVSNTQTHATTVSTSSQFTLNPFTSDQIEYPGGQEAWGFFLAPTVSNDAYEVYTPPQAYSPDTANDTGFTVYYVYTLGTSLVPYSFDITQPGKIAYFDGIPPMPASLDYQEWNDKQFHHSECHSDDNTSCGDFDVTPTSMNGKAKKTWTIQYTVENKKKKDIKNTIKISAGAFGFKTDMEGAIESSSDASTTFGTDFKVSYGLYQHDNPDDYPDGDLWLKSISFNAYLMTANTPSAYFIPKVAQQEGYEQYPWCLTWYVDSFSNYGGGSQYMVGPGEATGSLSAALAVEPGAPSASIKVTGSVSEPGHLVISGRMVTVQADSRTLGLGGWPTAVLDVSGISIAPDASLRLKDLIIQGDSKVDVLVNEGRLALENCVVAGGGNGILQKDGILRMSRVYIRQNALDGLRMTGGYAELVNCELVENGGDGLSLLGGDALLRHCGALGNGSSDVNASGQAMFKADNCLFGSVAPLSVVSLMRNCLVEVLPDDVVLGQRQACLLNMVSGCRVENGQIGGLGATSPCVDAGFYADVETDIMGLPRDDQPDIGPLEYIALPAAPAPEQVPAFSGVGVGLLALLLAGVGIAVARRRANAR